MKKAWIWSLIPIGVALLACAAFLQINRRLNNPQRPHHYSMDLGFLPRQAD